MQATMYTVWYVTYLGEWVAVMVGNTYDKKHFTLAQAVRKEKQVAKISENGRTSVRPVEWNTGRK